MRRDEMRKVLVVDDDKGFRDIVRIAAGRKGWEAVTYPQWNSAIGGLEKKEFTLIVCDYELQNDTALDLLKYMKSKNLSIPVIVVSASEDEKYRENALRAGAKEFYDKLDLKLQVIYEWLEYY